MSNSSKSFFKGFACVALAGLLFATTLPAAAQEEPPPPPPPAKKGLLVTYLVYSGRPNPTVTLTDPDQVAKIQARLAAAMESGSRVDGEAPEPILGYTGIMIEDLATSADKGGSWYVVKKDSLRVEGGNPEDPSARPATVSREALEIENSLISLGVESGVLDEATLSVVRDPKNTR
jgi:hypothetical protein